MHTDSLTEHGVHKIQTLEEHFMVMDKLIREVCGTNRQASLALTKLEESEMWALKSVVVTDSQK